MHTELRLLLICGVACALWAWASKGRETVDRISTRICRDLNLQRLDGSVALSRLRMGREDHGFGVQRIYRFEYSITGSDRRIGEICLLNAVPVWAHMDHPDGAIHIALR
jgi:hypothetical protein